MWREEIMGYSIEPTNDLLRTRLANMKEAARLFIEEHYGLQGRDSRFVIGWLDRLSADKLGSSAPSAYKDGKLVSGQVISRPVFIRSSPVVWNTAAAKNSSAKGHGGDGSWRDWKKTWHDYSYGGNQGGYHGKTNWGSHNRTYSQPSRYSGHYKQRTTRKTLDFFKSVQKHFLKPVLAFKCLSVGSALEDGLCPAREVMQSITPFYMNSSFWVFLVVFTMCVIISTLLCVRWYFGKDVYHFLERHPRILISPTNYKRSKEGVDNKKAMYHYHPDCQFTKLADYPRSHIFYPCGHCEWYEKRDDVVTWRNQNTGPLNEDTRARQPSNQGTVLISFPARNDQEANITFHPPIEQMNVEVARAQAVVVPPPPIRNTTEPEEETPGIQEASSTSRSLQNIRLLQRSVREQSLLLREQERLLQQRREHLTDLEPSDAEVERVDPEDSDVPGWLTNTHMDHDFPNFPTDFETAGYHH